MLQNSASPGLTEAQIGASATTYLSGVVIGALGFGYANDRLGRRKLFFLTLTLYLTATGLTAVSWNFATYAIFRALTGAGIGGEYAAINSAIDELIPARVRGHVDLIINATFWIGAAVGSLASIVFLNEHWFAPDMGWRFAFGIGATLGIAILFVRRHIPESPRRLMTHGRADEAQSVLARVEKEVSEAGCPLPPAEGSIPLSMRHHTEWREIWHAMAYDQRSRSVPGLILMASQAFFYNAIFFTYGLVLMRYYGTAAGSIGLYLLPFAAGNFLGPLLIGRLFDTYGRKPMIAITYAGAGILLLATGWMFEQGLLSATTQTLAWSAIFFIASTPASSAYLTVSEIFPLEIRALAIAFFFAAGTLVGGVAAPAFFAALIATGSRAILFEGYAAAAALMIVAAIAELVLGVAAERQPLENITAPLSAVDGRSAASAKPPAFPGTSFPSNRTGL